MMALISPSLDSMVVNPGLQVRSKPRGAEYPLAMAIALTAWFTAPAPTARNLTVLLSYTACAMADATDWGLEPAETLRNGSSVAATTFSISLNLCTFVVDIVRRPQQLC